MSGDIAASSSVCLVGKRPCIVIPLLTEAAVLRKGGNVGHLLQCLGLCYLLRIIARVPVRETGGAVRATKETHTEHMF